MKPHALLFVVAALVVALPSLHAQPVGQEQTIALWLPRVSPGASVAQAIGMAEVEVVYHRPSVDGRTIWGALVPYDQVWRTGANENTVVTFSHDVTLEEEPLPAGTYGLHSIPGEEQWTIIFSNETTAWGSFSYDEAQDALRVEVTPEEAPFRELMTFTFDDVTADSATLSLRWAGLRVPVSIETDTTGQTLASIRAQLEGLAKFNWLGWNQAATWALTNEVALEEALGWADTSIQNERRFENLSTRAQILETLGRSDEAEETIDAALEIATPIQVHGYGRQLLARGEIDEAMAVFERNAERNPDAWFIGVGFARAEAARGNFEKAAEHMRDALEKAPEGQKAYVEGLVKRLEAGEEI